MANALTLALPALPAANAGVAGIASGGNSNGVNSVSATFANGAPGAGDTIANAQFLAVMPAGSRLRELFSASYATVAAMNEAFAAAGLLTFVQDGGSALAFTNAAPGVPTATMTTSAATGHIRISIAQSVGA